MAYLNDSVHDSGLAWAIANGSHIHLVSTDPGGTYATVTGNELAKAAITLTGPADGPVDGRKLVAPETVFTPSASGNASHWAITDNTGTVIASRPLNQTKAVQSGVDATLAAFDAIIQRDPA